MNRLRELRKEKKYTLDDIEAKTGIKRGTYNNYESEKTKPKPGTWQELSKFYGVSVPYLQGIDKEIYDLKFPTKQEAIDFIHKIMRAQNIKLEDITDESKR